MLIVCYNNLSKLDWNHKVKMYFNAKSKTFEKPLRSCNENYLYFELRNIMMLSLFNSAVNKTTLIRANQIIIQTEYYRSQFIK